MPICNCKKRKIQIFINQTIYRTEYEERKKKKRRNLNTCDKDQAAIQSNESSEAVKETLEVKLVLEGTVRFVDTMKLNHPT